MYSAEKIPQFVKDVYTLMGDCKISEHDLLGSGFKTVDDKLKILLYISSNTKSVSYDELKEYLRLEYRSDIRRFLVGLAEDGVLEKMVEYVPLEGDNTKAIDLFKISERQPSQFTKLLREELESKLGSSLASNLKEGN